ncbi:MAG: hypothetical protein CVU90_05215 [Firmicutes bacterium HGW-Firmicutes-15]|nr:MAG: hypothetical protein CVU90_05215 [Firmicutes bacterium HGW-Firmicutes-15]
MKIAIYADRLESGGGLETHVITQVNELLQRGHQVFLSANAIVPYFLEAIKNDGSNFIFALFSDDPLNDLAEFKPDLVHAHPFSAIFRGYKVACDLNIPLFITIHGPYDFGVDRSPTGYLVASKANKIIAVDDTIESMLRRCVDFPEKIVTVYNGINRNDFYPASPDLTLMKELDVNASWRTIVVVSRLEDDKEKPVFQLMDCAPLLAERLGGLNLLIVGDGAYRDEVWERNRAQIENCSNLRVFRLGRRTDISKLHHIADLTIACGRAALEAMACKRPVFAAGSKGFAGIITYSNISCMTGREGYHCWNDLELLENLYHSLADEMLLEKAIMEGYKLVEKYFDIQKNTDKVESLYREALEDR